ncbi:TauD/TfdA family dioxygenase [Streptomyces sp. NBC_00638]|uniref:TauD/TfdA family dioxygenase n=1 Tax=Streptomyces sp. NBC_00638 TaxID=2975794 RepID=UPI002259E59F|nr:TauD/TfdA family dioxygenase [Streptomyces sp. NBC_00638]MCX5009143.1 TauD/TfdA family dioxygenase [Streptomyces sp. NBC_00638]
MTDRELIDEVTGRGYAVISTPVIADDPFEAHRRVAQSLGLPDAYTPLLYKDAEVRSAVSQVGPYNEIPRDTTSVQPWSEMPGQSFHVDGLLEPLGGIKTTLLHCLNQAHSGGETELFFSCDAFRQLLASDEDAAQSLLHPKALTRFATISESTPTRLHATGPAFGWVDATLTTRFSDGPTEHWNTSENPDLQRALDYLRGPARETHRVQVRLAPGEMLIFRNDRVSHRGCTYQNGAHPRRLTRSMYSSAPRHNSPHS